MGERTGGTSPAVLVLLAISVCASQAQENVPTSFFPLWDRSLSVRTGLGYKDNVLLSHFRPQESLFVAAGLEASVYRLAEDGTQVNLLLTADNNHYFSVPQLRDETLVLAQAQLKKPLGGAWETTVALEYFYQDQVLDVTATEVFLHTVHAQGHNLQLTPAIRRNFGLVGWLELSLPVARRIFNEPLDSFWEGGPKLTFGRPYGQRSEWVLGYSWSDRPYDTRFTVPIPDKRLVFHQHKFETASWHHWDAQRRWRSVTKLSYKLNYDNGGGYFDYGKIQLSEQLRFRPGKWELIVEARAARYDFDSQFVGTQKRELSEFVWRLRAERQFVKRLKGSLDFEQERNFSNQPIDRYTVNTVSGGLAWEF